MIDEWTTANGHTIKIVDMEDSHLYNTARMLKKKYDQLIKIQDLLLIEACAAAASFDIDSMASYHAESEVKELSEQVIEQHPAFEPICEELIDRGWTREEIFKGLENEED